MSMYIRHTAARQDTTYQEIPLGAGQVTGWKSIPVRESSASDPLVPLGPLASEMGNLTTSSLYFGEHSNSPYMADDNMLKGSLLTLFVRQSVARRLLAAEQLLPPGHHLLVFDAYRPYQVQKSLHEFYKQKLKKSRPDMDDGALEAETQKYVSLPSQDPAQPAPHSTGGAVDVAIIKLDQAHENEVQYIRSRLTRGNLSTAQRVGLEMKVSAIMRRHGHMLDFGTAFDHGGEKSALAYYESRIATGEMLEARDTLACNNRRLLFRVMTQVGFEPYFAEWWHFNAPESQMGAATGGRQLATFGAAGLTDSNRAHEHIRLVIHRATLRLQQEGSLAIPQTAVEAEILNVLGETGDPRLTKDWPAEIIAPPEGALLHH